MNQRYDVSDRALEFGQDGSPIFGEPLPPEAPEPAPTKKKTSRLGGIHRR